MTEEQIKTVLYQYFDQEKVDYIMQCKSFEKTGSRIPKGAFRDYVNVPLCCQLYEECSIPIYKLAMLYDASDVTLREYMIKNGTKIKGHHTSYDYSNNYFQNINTMDRAYFLGLMMADGNVRLEQEKYHTVSIALNQEDGYIIDKFKEKSNLHATCKLSQRLCRGKIRHTAYLSVRSKQLFEDLVKWGVYPNKSIKGTCAMPILEQKFIPHFIRGYFDGNGIAYKDGKIGFCGAKQLMYDIRNVLITECDASAVKVTYNNMNHIFYITWSNKHIVKNILKYMYQDAQDLFLTRKYNKVVEGLKARSIVIC